MTYRTIAVDGREYKWTVGKTFVKIKGFQAIHKNDFPATGDSGLCSCGSKYCSIDDGPCGVGPADIANYIKNNPKEKP